MDFWISDLVETLMELIFNPCGEFQWSKTLMELIFNPSGELR